MMPDTVLEAAFPGSISSALVRASEGLVRLEFFDWGVRLRANLRLFRRLIPVWEARYEDLATTQLIQGIAGFGVRFASPADEVRQRFTPRRSGRGGCGGRGRLRPG
jgi:hypothetical protein